MRTLGNLVVRNPHARGRQKLGVISPSLSELLFGAQRFFPTSLIIHKTDVKVKSIRIESLARRGVCRLASANNHNRFSAPKHLITISIIVIRYLDLFKISGYSLTAAVADQLPFHFTQIGRWWDKNEELDVMALDSTKRQILLGECKYRNAPFDLAEFHHMRSKYAPPVQDAAIHYCLFSKSGFCDELRRFAEEEKIMLFGLDEIVRPDAAP